MSPENVIRAVTNILQHVSKSKRNSITISLFLDFECQRTLLKHYGTGGEQAQPPQARPICYTLSRSPVNKFLSSFHQDKQSVHGENIRQLASISKEKPRGSTQTQ